MAFGKDPRLALQGGSFRQTAQLHSRNRVVNTHRKGAPYFVDKYEPGLMAPDVVRLIPGNYLQEQAVGEGDNVQVVQYQSKYIQFVDHFLGRAGGEKGKSCICSAGPLRNFKTKRNPCRGCDIFWETAVRDPKTNRLDSPVISRQRKFAICVLDYGNYHKLEQYDPQTGQMKINQKTGEPFFNWVKCLGMGCDACRANKEVKHGDMRHWPMSSAHFRQLLSTALNIGNACARCCTTAINGQSPIRSIAWTCSNCGNTAIDMATTELKMDELMKITDDPYVCPDCQTEVLLEEQITCAECANRGQQGVRAGLFDVDLSVQLVETGQNAKMLNVMGWSPPRPVDPNYAALAVPIDLVAKYAPDSMEYQISRFGPPSAAAQAARTPVTTGATPNVQQYTAASDPATRGFSPSPVVAPSVQSFTPYGTKV
jgi:hypothetical protein